MTPAEKLLESRLKGRMTSQGIVGIFIADFVCYVNKVVVEVNGSIHDLRNIKRKDAYKKLILRRLGYRVIVFTNKQVFDNCDKVLAEILKYL